MDFQIKSKKLSRKLKLNDINENAGIRNDYLHRTSLGHHEMFVAKLRQFLIIQRRCLTHGDQLLTKRPEQQLVKTPGLLLSFISEWLFNLVTGLINEEHKLLEVGFRNNSQVFESVCNRLNGNTVLLF